MSLKFSCLTCDYCTPVEDERFEGTDNYCCASLSSSNAGKLVHGNMCCHLHKRKPAKMRKVEITIEMLTDTKPDSHAIFELLSKFGTVTYASVEYEIQEHSMRHSIQDTYRFTGDNK